MEIDWDTDHGADLRQHRLRLNGMTLIDEVVKVHVLHRAVCAQFTGRGHAEGQGRTVSRRAEHHRADLAVEAGSAAASAAADNGLTSLVEVDKRGHRTHGGQRRNV